MGRDLVLIVGDGEEACNLGRAHYYDWDDDDEDMQAVVARMNMLAAYTPRSLDEIKVISEEVDHCLEVAQRQGRKSVLKMLQGRGFAIKEWA